ncbi:hypothetical protein OS493_012377 [Desmophyllum pertusum]|uniref:Uncharacterized protein n=1 Tax=Desmophyllum pertusum TaxID=174260 RepID=A0A9W9ZQG1_9CNID|nr:hypothetical protein OS493_012377 [Desmophyllum pertusum]
MKKKEESIVTTLPCSTVNSDSANLDYDDDDCFNMPTLLSPLSMEIDDNNTSFQPVLEHHDDKFYQLMDLLSPSYEAQDDAEMLMIGLPGMIACGKNATIL